MYQDKILERENKREKLIAEMHKFYRKKIIKDLIVPVIITAGGLATLAMPIQHDRGLSDAFVYGVSGLALSVGVFIGAAHTCGNCRERRRRIQGTNTTIDSMLDAIGKDKLTE